MQERSRQLQKEIDARHGQCPECGDSYEPIRLFGRSGANPISGAAIDAELTYYTDHDAARSAFHAMYTEIGYIHAAMCPSCRKVDLRAEPKTYGTSSNADNTESIACLSCGEEIPAGSSECGSCGWSYRDDEQDESE